jgi:UDP-glucose 4-epimerase
MPTSTDKLTLVTGGAGFIGSHLIERLVARGDRVVVIDNLSTGRRSNLAVIDTQRLTVIESTCSEGIANLDPADFAEIYHLAAAVGVRLVVEQPTSTIENNVLETSAILAFAARGKTPILIASTSEVYGKSADVPFSEDADVVYGSPHQSRWAYACSKAIDEFLAVAHAREHDLPVVVARFFNIVGPRQVGTWGMVLPRFIERAVAGRPIEVYGDGRQTRCFCDVRDMVGVLPQLLASQQAGATVVNVGSDESIEILGLAELVRDTLSSTSPIVHVEYEEAFGEGFDDLRHRKPDLTRLRAATGFRLRITLQQTIKDLAADPDRRSARAETLA